MRTQTQIGNRFLVLLLLLFPTVTVAANSIPSNGEVNPSLYQDVTGSGDSSETPSAETGRPHGRIEKGMVLGYHTTHWEPMTLDGWRWHSEPQAGVSIGGFLAFPVGSRLVLQPQLLYTDKREKKYWSDIGLGSRRFELPAPRYLELPLLVRGHLASAGSVRFQLVAGPLLGMVISDLIAADDGGVSDGEKGTLGWGGIVGLSVALGSVMLDVRRTWEWYGSDEPTPLHNRTLAFMFGINIRSLPIR